MLGINVTYIMRPEEGSRESFLLGASQVREEVLREEGCLQYDYFFPVEAPDKLLLVEKWTSREAQRVHMGQPHMAKITQLKERYVQSVTLEFYDLEEKG